MLPSYFVAADGEQDVLFRDLEASGEHGLEVRFVSVLPKTGHFSGAGHLHPEHHVGSGQPGEGELRNLEDGRYSTNGETQRREVKAEPTVLVLSSHLHSHNPFSTHETDRLHFNSHDGLRCQGNKVDSQRLGYKREGAGNSDVAFNHLQLVILERKSLSQH